MLEWGWTVPVLVDKQGTLVSAHGRVLAAQLLGITDVPTMVARGWTHAQIQAYRLADNQLALNAGWDRELLGLECRSSLHSPGSSQYVVARIVRRRSCPGYVGLANPNMVRELGADDDMVDVGRCRRRGH